MYNYPFFVSFVNFVYFKYLIFNWGFFPLITEQTCSGVTESLLFIYLFFLKIFGGGGKHSSGAYRTRITLIFFPITFIVHNQKSNGGGRGEWETHGVNGGSYPSPPPPSYATADVDNDLPHF